MLHLVSVRVRCISMAKLTFCRDGMDRFMAASKILGEETANGAGAGAGVGSTSAPGGQK